MGSMQGKPHMLWTRGAVAQGRGLAAGAFTAGGTAPPLTLDGAGCKVPRLLLLLEPLLRAQKQAGRIAFTMVSCTKECM